MKPSLFGEIQEDGMFAEYFSSRDILGWTPVRQETLKKELTELFPKIFLAEKDWDYVVRHYFFDPAPLVRHTLFVRDAKASMIATACFDMGPVNFCGKEKTAAYVHIRALLPGIQGAGLGKIMARWMLSHKPDYLFTTCMQPASLYSWMRLVDKDLQNQYEVWPRQKKHGKINVLPPELLGEAFSFFTQVYRGHVKGDIERVEEVVRNLTVRFIRKGVGMTFASNPWESNRFDALVRHMDLRESDGVLMVIRRKQ